MVKTLNVNKIKKKEKLVSIEEKKIFSFAFFNEDDFTEIKEGMESLNNKY